MRTACLVSVFDIVDGGDLHVLRRAREECGRLTARVVGDRDLYAMTGRVPLVPGPERLEIVRSLRHVEEADMFDPVELWGDGGSTVVYGRSDQYLPSLPVHRWIEPAPPGPRISSPAGKAAGERPGQEGLVVGYVPGAWDMFHIGHLNLLRRARAECDRLVVGVVTDETLRQAKGHAPQVPLEERFDVVAAIGLVDDVVVDRSTSKLDAWERVHFDLLFKGSDWQGTPKGARLEAEMAEVGARVRYFPYTEHTSSSRLRRIRATG